MHRLLLCLDKNPLRKLYWRLSDVWNSTCPNTNFWLPPMEVIQIPSPLIIGSCCIWYACCVQAWLLIFGGHSWAESKVHVVPYMPVAKLAKAMDYPPWPSKLLDPPWRPPVSPSWTSLRGAPRCVCVCVCVCVSFVDYLLSSLIKRLLNFSATPTFSLHQHVTWQMMPWGSLWCCLVWGLCLWFLGLICYCCFVSSIIINNNLLHFI